MAESLEKMFPKKPEDNQMKTEEQENPIESIEEPNRSEAVEDQQQQATETPEVATGSLEQTDQEGVEAARQSLEAAFGDSDQAEKTQGTGDEHIVEEVEEPGEYEEDPEEKFQGMINAARTQLDKDRGIETAQTEENPEIVEHNADLESDKNEAAEMSPEDVELTPEMKEYLDEMESRMEEELEGMDEIENNETGIEKKERPKRGALKKAMLVVTAAAALWMFQATTAPDTAHAKSSKSRIEKLMDKQKKKMKRAEKRIKKAPEKITKGISKDIQRTLNGMTKDIIKGIFD